MTEHDPTNQDGAAQAVDLSPRGVERRESMLSLLLDQQRTHVRTRRCRRGALAATCLAALAAGALLLQQQPGPAAPGVDGSPQNVAVKTQADSGHGAGDALAASASSTPITLSSVGSAARESSSERFAPRRLVQVLGEGNGPSHVVRFAADPDILRRLTAGGSGATRWLDDSDLLRTLARASGRRGTIVVDGHVVWPPAGDQNQGSL